MKNLSLWVEFWEVLSPYQENVLKLILPKNSIGKLMEKHVDADKD